MTLGSFDKKRNVVVGSFLSDKRLAAGLSQIQVAQALGLKSAQSVSNIERGLCGPPLASLRKMIRIYGLSTQEVVTLLVTQYKEALGEALAKPSKAVKVAKAKPRGRPARR